MRHAEIQEKRSRGREREVERSRERLREVERERERERERETHTHTHTRALSLSLCVLMHPPATTHLLIAFACVQLVAEKHIACWSTSATVAADVGMPLACSLQTQPKWWAVTYQAPGARDVEVMMVVVMVTALGCVAKASRCLCRHGLHALVGMVLCDAQLMPTSAKCFCCGCCCCCYWRHWCWWRREMCEGSARYQVFVAAPQSSIASDQPPLWNQTGGECVCMCVCFVLFVCVCEACAWV